MCGMRGLIDDDVVEGMIIHAQPVCEVCLNLARMKRIKNVVHGFSIFLDFDEVHIFETQSDALVVQGFSGPPS